MKPLPTRKKPDERRGFDASLRLERFALRRALEARLGFGLAVATREEWLSSARILKEERDDLASIGEHVEAFRTDRDYRTYNLAASLV